MVPITWKKVLKAGCNTSVRWLQQKLIMRHTEGRSLVDIRIRALGSSVVFTNILSCLKKDSVFMRLR